MRTKWRLAYISQKHQISKFQFTHNYIACRFIQNWKIFKFQLKWIESFQFHQS